MISTIKRFVVLIRMIGNNITTIILIYVYNLLTRLIRLIIRLIKLTKVVSKIIMFTRKSFE